MQTILQYMRTLFVTSTRKTRAGKKQTLPTITNDNNIGFVAPVMDRLPSSVGKKNVGGKRMQADVMHWKSSRFYSVVNASTKAEQTPSNLG